CTAPCGATQTCRRACPPRSRTHEGPGFCSVPTRPSLSLTKTGLTWWCGATSAWRRASTCPLRRTWRGAARPSFPPQTTAGA
ncbi:unnamed protein product, partial [Ectocarpus sp. 13 AM-2016]